MTGWALWIHGVRPVPELVVIARAAEAHGAAALLLADEGIERDIYVTLAAIAGATRTLKLVPAITNPHSRHPVATAVALATLAELAPGRLVAGLGVGGNMVLGPMGLHPARPFTALAEAVDVVDRLLAGEVVDHEGEFTAAHAAIPWSPERLPIGIAGRGPRVRRLAAERADWVILAGLPVEAVPALIGALRRDQVVVWNPSAAWREEHVEALRGHFAYITVDLPAAEREALGVGDALVEALREAVHREGPAAAARLVPPAVLERYAIAGTPDEVGSAIARTVAAASPRLIAFHAHEYTPEYVAEVADVAARAGLSAALPEAV